MESKIKTIQLNGQELIVRKNKGFAGQIAFERMSKNRTLGETEEILFMMFSYLKAYNVTKFKYTFDEFIELLDEQPEVFEELKKIGEEENEEVEKVTEKKKRANS